MDNRQSMQFKTSMHVGEVYIALRRFEYSYEGATSFFAKQYQNFTMILKCALRTHTNNAPECNFAVLLLKRLLNHEPESFQEKFSTFNN